MLLRRSAKETLKNTGRRIQAKSNDQNYNQIQNNNDRRKRSHHSL